jgi:hypothetical protein
LRAGSQYGGKPSSATHNANQRAAYNRNSDAAKAAPGRPDVYRRHGQQIQATGDISYSRGIIKIVDLEAAAIIKLTHSFSAAHSHR